MAEVPREEFAPEDKRALAYADLTLSLGNGRRLNLPMATGRMLNELALTRTDHVLVVGAATGYSAALCARLAKSVVALESDADLAAFARTALAPYANVEPVAGPLTEGWAKLAPYDAILIDGFVEHIPEAIVDQLAERGRLAAGLLDEGIVRLVYGRKQGGGFGTIAFADAQSAPLPGFARPKAFVF
jgi:protein-L-isoaspartate(D-aspartate) O-methyltransferase